MVEDGSSSRAWAFELDAKRKDEAADEFARLAAALARHGFQHAAQSLLRVGREHRLFAPKERAEAAAIRGDTD